ncbi:hypothetical protein GW17_00007528, partial [Ensete ventricosum]
NLRSSWSGNRGGCVSFCDLALWRLRLKLGLPIRGHRQLSQSDGKRPRVRLGRSAVGVVEPSFGFPFLREGHLRKASRAAMDGKQNKDGSLDGNSHSAAVSYVFNLKSLSSISMQDTFSIISSDKSKRRTQY